MKKIAFWNGSVFTLVLAAALLAAPDISAQGTGAAAPRREISRDLWNLWRKGFELFEKGEMKMISGKYEESIPFYQQSLDAFNQVKKQNPDWNKSVIDYRISLSTRRIASAISFTSPVLSTQMTSSPFTPDVWAFPHADSADRIANNMAGFIFQPPRATPYDAI